MKQFILNTKQDTEGFYRIRSHYLVRVRRLVAGDIFPALLQDDTVLSLQVCSVEDDCLVCESRGSVPNHRPQDPLPPLVLFQAMPKGAKIDLIIRQAVESGVNEIVPFFSEYSVSKRGADKIERWNRIITEARQQSGSHIDTKVREPVSLAAALMYWKELANRYSHKVGLLFHQDMLEPTSFYRCLTPVPHLLAVAVGPEGGFSPDDLAQFSGAGFTAVALGNTVLRTETAALAAITTVRVVLLEIEKNKQE
ncbi:MAG: 16S rRNA (uracil(1498)-N(3))-methyltransferase [Spirochaetaceae bacterium]|jgi:16S rRNA (uracil1498-N3)-methyltransferase|nr:16S rRNA (uracil(1498)-N(3))-methyltransferase [Spirochaetaceae bacterium]